MKAYAVQMHLHGSMSEGSASCMAHDHMAAETGHADVIWWTDHDFRVANFGKLQRFAFTGLSEEIDHPNRDPEAVERLSRVAISWRPVETDTTTGALAEVSTEAPFREGSGSLRLVLPQSSLPDANGSPEQRCTYELRMGAHYETFPLATQPVLRLATRPESTLGADAQVLVRFVLSEQPPDLKQTRITYVLGGSPDGDVTLVQTEHGPGEALVTIPHRAGEWNEYVFDLAADAMQLGLRGGLDNSLHRLQIGLTSRGPAVAASFGHLEVSVSHRGPRVLDLHRRLLVDLPTRVRHHVGLEISYYGRHITGFGASVPIPDYEALLPGGLTSDQVVAHIHRHGGLACLAHPPRTDPEGTATLLAERRLFGADMMEVAHAAAGLPERLRLWDALARRGLVVTGTGVSDAHSARAGWRPAGGGPVSWVTRIWAASDEEADLLDGLRRGHAFFADPSEFRGDIDLAGPGGIEMGDAAVISGTAAAPGLEARVSGLRAGDLLTWLCNGALVRATAVAAGDSGDTLLDRWQPTVPVTQLLAVRIQVHRPIRAMVAHEGIIACSNPVYLSPTVPETSHRVRVLS